MTKLENRKGSGSNCSTGGGRIREIRFGKLLGMAYAAISSARSCSSSPL